MITFKRGDTAQTITDTLTLGGVPLDLTDASVTFVMRLTRKLADKTMETVVRGGTATVTGNTAGTVRYTVSEDDVEFVREGKGEWEITFPEGGRILTVPNDGYIDIKIIADLNPPA